MPQSDTPRPHRSLISGQRFYRLRKFCQHLLDPFARLNRHTLTVRDAASLHHAMGWQLAPDLDFDHLLLHQTAVDVNHRPLRDAEVIAGAARNLAPGIILEIGTGAGHTTALLARNAPAARIYTVNILPEEIDAGGTYVTDAPSREEIGAFYRRQGCTNITQLYANTATWQPDLDPIDIAFIDGCHDADFVYRDTLLVLRHSHPGTVILWHDFSPSLVDRHPWIADVCLGVQQLFHNRILSGPIYHLQDSWVGMHTVRPSDLTGHAVPQP